MKRRTAAIGTGILLAVLVIAGLGAEGLESWVNRRADRARAEIAAALGRPIEAAPIDVTFLSGLGIEVRDVVIGPEPSGDERDPALRIARLRVRVGIWGTLLSFGRRPKVEDVQVERLQANVIRRSDRTLNWERIAERLPRRPEQPRADPSWSERLHGLRVDVVRVEDGQVRFVDRTGDGGQAAITDLDLAMDQASLREGFEVRLSAAVLGKVKNLQANGQFGALPRADHLATPPLERLTVKMSPTNLAPLAPFLEVLGAPAAGTLAIDLTATGGAVPGAKGQVSLDGVRWPGGQAFDARLETDLRAQPERGDLDVSRFVLRVGDMSLQAHGKILGLKSTPRFERFALTSQGLDFDTLRAYVPKLTERVSLSGPFLVQAHADGGQGSGSFEARVDLSRASIIVPGKLRKPAGTALVFTAAGSVSGERLLCERYTFQLGPAQVVGRGSLRHGSFDTTAEVSGLPVREVMSLVAPARALAVPQVRISGSVRAQGTLGRPEALRVQAPSFTVTGGRSELKGRLRFSNPHRPRVDLDARAAYLDLEDLLPPRSVAPARSSNQRGASAASAGGPSFLERVQGQAHLAVARGRAAGIDYHQLEIDATLAAGWLRARALQVSALGGRFSGSGTELPLDGVGPFVVKGRVTSLDMGALLGRLAGDSDVLRGRLHAQIDLSGQGTRREDLLRTLSGTLEGRIEQARFAPASVLGSLSKALTRAVAIPGLARRLATAEARVPALATRDLGTLTGAVRFTDGALRIARPLDADTPYGPLSLEGRVFVDGRADFTGTLALAPETIALLSDGTVRLSEPLPVRLRVTGPLTRPSIAPIETERVVRKLAAAFLSHQAQTLGADRAEEVLPDAAKQRAKEAREAGRKIRRIFRR